MDSLQKLSCSLEHTDFEVAEDVNLSMAAISNRVTSPLPLGVRNQQNGQSKRSTISNGESFPVYRAVLPNGKRIPLLKTLLTTACEKNCNYCSCRSGRDFERYSLSPDELASTFMDMVNAGIVNGIFLSSSIAGGGVRTQDRILKSADILRNRMGYQGYIHLKLMPGSEKEQVEEAMKLSDRVSINLEAPTRNTLMTLAPQKNMFDEILQPLRWVDEIKRNHPPVNGWKGKWSSATTQFVVGAGNETDRELLQTTDYLYREFHLARAYYSGFRPVPGTPFENNPPADNWRQHRLYQASYLLRDYHYSVNELPFSDKGFLSLSGDPKLEWAKMHLAENPLEINRADYFELLRIPGIGPRNARSIILNRRKNPLHGAEDIRSLGIMIERVAPFIVVNGKRLPRQLTLW